MAFELTTQNIYALQQQLKSYFRNDDELKDEAEALKLDGTIDDDDKVLIDAWESKNSSTDGVETDSTISENEAKLLGLDGFRSSNLEQNEPDTVLLQGFLRGFTAGKDITIDGIRGNITATTEAEIKQSLLNSDLPYEVISQLSADPKKFTQNDIRILQQQWSNVPEELKNGDFALESINEGTSGSLLGVGLTKGFNSYLDPDATATEAINKLLETFGLEQNGEYTQELADAVKAFQEEKGILADGIVGPQTESTIEAAIAEIERKLNDGEDLEEYETTIATNLGLVDDEGNKVDDALEDFNSNILAARDDNAFTTRSNRGVNIALNDDGELVPATLALSDLSSEPTAKTDVESAILELSSLTPSQLNKLISEDKVSYERDGKNLVATIDGNKLTVEDFYSKEGESDDLNSDIAENGFTVIRFGEENGVTQEISIRDMINDVRPPIVFDPGKVDAPTAGATANTEVANVENGTLILPSLNNSFDYNTFVGEEASVSRDGENLVLDFGDSKTLTITGVYKEDGTDLNQNLIEKPIQYIQLADGKLISLNDLLNGRRI